MDFVLHLFQKISHWGIRTDSSEQEIRNILLMNRMMLIAAVVTIFLASIFLYLRLYVNLFFISFYDLLFVAILYFNKKQKIHYSLLLISIFPTVIVAMSIFTKIIRQTETLELVFAPHNSLILFGFFVMILIDLGKKKHYLFLLPSFICLVFFKELHALFGIQIYDYGFGQNIFVVRFSYMAVFIALIFGVNSLHIVNRIFDKKIKELLKISSEKNEELELQNQLISDKNQQITDSIKYALRIQQAILGNPERLQKIFPQSFIFFSPKDIVSGDFYWFYQKEDTKIVIAADCTGHGVSGAFMTVLGSDLLDNIVKNQEIFSPAQILTNLDKAILAVLQKDSSIADGMDASVLRVEKEKIWFSGAKNPLYFVKNNQIDFIKGSKSPIGGSYYYKDKIFEESELLIDTQLDCYLFSDGFQDQFGGTENRKFLNKRFRELLFSIHSHALTEQKLILEQTIRQWKGNLPQTDDILVIGIRFTKS